MPLPNETVTSLAMALVKSSKAPMLLLDDDEAIAQVLRVRPQAWPNARMIAFADALLGRRGRLIAALDRFQLSRGMAY